MAEHGTTGHPGQGLMSQPLRCVVVTPEATVLETTAQFVALPLLDGEMGIMPGHSPMIGRLGIGELRVEENGQTRRFYLDSGFVQVAENVISILTNRAIPAEKLDPAVIAEQLAAARTRTAHSPETMAQRDRQEQQARAQLRVAEHAGGRSHAAAAGGNH